MAVFGRGMTAHPAPAVRGVDLAATEPLARRAESPSVPSQEWTVIVLGARTAATLIAHDCGDTGLDSDRRFNFAVTHDRDVVTQAARAMLDRI